MIGRRLAMQVAAPLMFLLAMTAGAQHAALQRPVLAVFDFESDWDEGARGRQVAEMFRGDARRSDEFVQYDLPSFRELLAGTDPVTLDTPPGEVATIARERIEADVAIWGRVERLAKDSYRLRVKILDLRENAETPALDRTYDSTLHGLSVSVDRALAAFLKKEPQPERDLAAETAWRDRKNLVKNGGFELGDSFPDGWERVDGLATFWVDDGSGQGKCAMMDTMVLKEQYEAWRKAFEAGAAADEAPEKVPPKPPYYDTIGGTIGAHLYSDPIPVTQGQAYRVDLEYRGKPGETKVFVKGYAPFYGADGSVAHRETYRSQINLYPETDGEEWEHAARIIHPTQPFHLLIIRSEFDKNDTGRTLRGLLAEEIALQGIHPISRISEVDHALGEDAGALTFEASKYPVAQLVQNRLGRGVIVWGDVQQNDQGLEVRLRSLDVREDAVTKDWWTKKTVKADELEEAAKALAREIVVNARPVVFLRVKLDAYWPAGRYFFDDVWITEEPSSDPAAPTDGHTRDIRTE